MNDANKKYLDSLSTELNKTNGLSKTAELIEKTQKELFAIFDDKNEKYDDKDLEKLETIKEQLEDKKNTFKEQYNQRDTVINYFIDTDIEDFLLPFKDIQSAETISGAAIKPKYKTNKYADEAKKMIDRYCMLANIKKDQKDNLLAKGKLVFSNGYTKKSIREFIQGFDPIQHTEDDMHAGAIKHVLTIAIAIHTLTEDKQYNDKNPNYQKLQKALEEIKENINPTVVWLLYTNHMIDRIDQIVEKNKKSKTTTTTPATTTTPGATKTATTTTPVNKASTGKTTVTKTNILQVEQSAQTENRNNTKRTSKEIFGKEQQVFVAYDKIKLVSTDKNIQYKTTKAKFKNSKMIQVTSKGKSCSLISIDIKDNSIKIGIKPIAGIIKFADEEMLKSFPIKIEVPVYTKDDKGNRVEKTITINYTLPKDLDVTKIKTDIQKGKYATLQDIQDIKESVKGNTEGIRKINTNITDMKKEIEAIKELLKKNPKAVSDSDIKKLQEENKKLQEDTKKQIDEATKKMSEDASKIQEEIKKITEQLEAKKKTRKTKTQAEKDAAKAKAEQDLQDALQRLSGVDNSKTAIEQLHQRHKEVIQKIETKSGQDRDKIEQAYTDKIQRLTNAINTLIQRIEELQKKPSLKELQNCEIAHNDLQTQIQEAEKELESLEDFEQNLQNQTNINNTQDPDKDDNNSESEPNNDQDPVNPDDQEPQDPGTIQDDIGEIKDDIASISNVTNISYQEAERKVEEYMRDKIHHMAWYNMPGRLYYFMMRKRHKEHEIHKMIKDKQWFTFEGDKKFAVDRHQLQLHEGFDNTIDNLVTITQNNYPNAYTEINKLVERYVNRPNFSVNAMTDNVFETEFDRIIMDEDMDTTTPTLKQIMEKNDMAHVSSNILHRTRMFKDHQAMVQGIIKSIEEVDNKVLSGQILSADQNAALSKLCKPMIQKYITTYDTIPDFMKVRGLDINDPALIEKIKLDQAHNAALTVIAAQSLRLKIQILNKGKAAYQLGDQDHGIITKAGQFRDGHWIDNTFKWPKSRAVAHRLFGATKLAGTAWVIAGFGLTSPLAIGVATGATVFGRTLITKFSHYTKEYEGQARNHAVNVEKYNEAQDRLQKRVDRGELKWFHRYFWNEKGEARRHRERYTATTHKNMILSQTLAGDIKQYVNIVWQLDTTQQTNLQNAVYEALARIDLYKQTGQNFAGSNQFDQAEDDIRKLYNVANLGAQRLGIDIKNTAYTRDPNYTRHYGRLKRNFDKTFNEFQSRRRKMWWSRAVLRWMVSGGLSYLSHYLFDKKEVITNKNETEIGGNTEHFELSKYNGHELVVPTADLKTDFDSFTGTISSGSQVHVDIGIGTDGTRVANIGKYATDLATTKTQLETYVTSWPFSQATKDNVKAIIDGTSNSSLSDISVKRTTDLTAAGKTNLVPGNPDLAQLRFLEGIEQALKSTASTNATNIGTIDFNFDFDQAASIAGTTYKTPNERLFTTCWKILTEDNKVNVIERAYGMPIPFDNTYKTPNGRDTTGKGATV